MCRQDGTALCVRLGVRACLWRAWHGMAGGMFGTLENCLLSEEVLFELMKKPSYRQATRIAGQGVGAVRDGLHLFVGGLCKDAGDLGKVVPWVKTLFSSLISVAMDAYRAFRPTKKSRQATKWGKDKYNPPAELRMIQRMYAMQVAKKPFKASRPLNFVKATPPSTPSPPPSPSFDSPIDGDMEDELENNNGDDRTPSKASGINGGAAVAGARLTALTAQPRRPQAQKTPTLLQAPFNLKRKMFSSPSSPSPATVHAPARRQPLAQRNLPDGPSASSPALPVFSIRSPSIRLSLGPLWFPQDVHSNSVPSLGSSLGEDRLYW
ncbi:hypothetical protein K438DRAFT_549801 [Mycena galopus ATCC 62051]|nr:hypothetical protein K438DRAFT_549801 [Mycena galopus ATCC 62051]